MRIRFREAYYRRFHWILIGLIGSVDFVRGAMFLALIPSYIPAHLQTTVFLSGAIISSMYGADTIFKPAAGWLVDYFGPRATLLVSLPFALLGLSVFLWSKSGAILVLGAILFGLGCASVWPSVVSALVDLSPDNEKAGTLSSIFVVWLVGMGSGYVLINLVYYLGPRFLIMVLLGIFCIPILLAFNIRKWISRRRISRESHAGHQLKRMILEVWNFRALLPGAFTQTLALSMLLPLLQPFCKEVYGLGHSAYGILILVGGLVTISLLVPVGKMVDRFGYRPFLVAGFLLSGVLLVAISRYPGPLLIYPYAALLGLSYAVILPSWNSLLAQKLPGEVRASLFSIIMSIQGLGVAAGPVVGGKLGATYGYSSTFGISAAALIAMAAFYLLLFDRPFSQAAHRE